MTSDTVPFTDTLQRTRLPQRWQQVTARALWWTTLAVCLVLFLMNFMQLIYITLTVCDLPVCPNPFYLTSRLVGGFQHFGLSPVLWMVHIAVLETLMMLVYATIAALLFWRRSDDWLALTCSLVLVTLAISIGLSGSTGDGSDQAWLRLSHAVNVIAVLLGQVFLYTFPDGRFTPGWMRWLLLPAAAWEIGRRALGVGVVTPAGFNIAGFLVTAAFFVFPVISQIYRFRNVSTPAQRQQTKWVVLMGAVTLLGISAVIVLYFGVLPLIEGPTLLLNVLLRLAYYAALVATPLGVAFSLLRYRLWDVDLLLNRSLVYTGLTLGLGLLFLTGYLIVQVTIRLVTGGESTALALVVSTAVIAAAFDPARRRVQRVIDRRLFGLRVDLDVLEQRAERAHDAQGAARRGALTGTVLGKYELGALIGRGGMGEVYQGAQPALGRTVAVKVLPPDRAHHEEFRQRFEREARAIAGLHHPNVVSIFDFGSSETGVFYMVMEYVKGRELGAELRERGALPFDEAHTIAADVAAALDYAHAQGIVHRDVKPSNVMLQPVTSTGTTPRGGAPRTFRAVLMDFGIVKLAGDAGGGLTQTGMIGTLDYIAPEQILNARSVDARADVYALGVMTYQMLTGELPFKGSVGQMVFAHLQQPAPDPRALRPDVPDACAHAVLRALAKKPEDRFETAGAFAAALRHAEAPTITIV